MNGDEVRLQLPGDPAYGRLARIAVTSLARRLGFTFRQMEDLGLAVDETVILLLQPGSDGPAPTAVDVRLLVDGGGLRIAATAVGAGPSAAAWPAADALERFTELVDPVVAEWSVEGEARTVHLTAQR